LPLAPLLPSLGALPTSPTDIAAWACAGLAAALIIVGAFVRMMIPLRALAVASNLGFALYGALHPSILMLLLHAALLPINIYRLAEMVRLTRRVAEVRAQPDLSGLWLRDYMRSAKLKRQLAGGAGPGGCYGDAGIAALQLRDIGAPDAAGQSNGFSTFLLERRSSRLGERKERH